MAAEPIWNCDPELKAEAEREEEKYRRAKPNGRDSAPRRTILSGSDFVASFVPPDWLIDGIVQRGRLYACTSITGHGKTAVWLYNACRIHAGLRIGHLDVAPGNALILAGENPEDLKARMIGETRALNLTSKQLPYVLPATFPITEDEAEKLRQQIAALGVPISLIVCDTAASFFPGDDDNHNVQAGSYARTLRTLTTCAGIPAVVVLSHPVKNASRDNLLPRGGGAFLNEMDGNLTLWSDQLGEITTLHWQGKIRGPDFDPLTYRLKPIKTGYRDTRDRDVMTVVAHPIDDIEASNEAAQAVANEDAVLKTMHDNPAWSFADIAKAIGWVNDDGRPEKWRVQRAVKRLDRDQLVRKFRGKWRVTEAGKNALKEAA
jgi:hypothetical protein